MLQGWNHKKKDAVSYRVFEKIIQYYKESFLSHFNRTPLNDMRGSYAFVITDPYSQDKTALQFDQKIPSELEFDMPLFTNICHIHINHDDYIGFSRDHKEPLYGRALMDVEIRYDDIHTYIGQLVFFSPQIHQYPYRSDILRASGSLFKKEGLEPIETGSVTQRICHQSVISRTLHKRRRSSKKIMKMSASEAYSHFANRTDSFLDPLAKEMIEQGLLQSQSAYHYPYKMEWLHMIGRALTPEGSSAYSKKNMLASFGWVNTLMLMTEMSLQRIAFLSEAIRAEHIMEKKSPFELDMNARFSKINQNNILYGLELEAHFSYKNFFIKTLQKINPFGEAVLIKGSDIAYTFLCLIHLLFRAPFDYISLTSEKKLRSLYPVIKDPLLKPRASKIVFSKTEYDVSILEKYSLFFKGKKNNTLIFHNGALILYKKNNKDKSQASVDATNKALKNSDEKKPYSWF